MIKSISKIIPNLSASLRKGDCGRVGVFGGSFEYSGAPFFAAKASLITGADLVSVFCSSEAGPVLKGYCPELIVYPILVDCSATEKEIAECIEKLSKMLSRLDSVVIGPGLGRDSTTLNVIREVISKAVELKIPMVLDADALYLIQKDLKTGSPSITLNQNCVLTPNKNEFGRLLDALAYSASAKDEATSCQFISKSLNGVTVIQKGSNDLISTMDKSILCSRPGSLRRIGGQGDILAGCVATFLAWGKIYERNPDNAALEHSIGYLSAFAGALLMRASAFEAYSSKGRAMVTSDVLDFIGHQFRELYEKKSE